MTQGGVSRAVLVAVLLMGSPASGHELSQAEIEGLVQREILNHEQQRQLFAFCSEIAERVATLAESCVERHEMGIDPPRCNATKTLQEGAVLQSMPVCAVYAAIAERCHKAHYPAKGVPTGVESHIYMACLRHPPVAWLEEETKRHSPLRGGK